MMEIIFIGVGIGSFCTVAGLSFIIKGSWVLLLTAIVGIFLIIFGFVKQYKTDKLRDDYLKKGLITPEEYLNEWRKGSLKIDYLVAWSLIMGGFSFLISSFLFFMNPLP